MSVLRGKGDGTFGSPINYATGGTYADAIVAGNLNRDGRLDLIVANTGSDNLTVFLNQP